MTEPQRPSAIEEDLAKFLERANIPYVWGRKDMLPLTHPQTGKPHYPDFFIPTTSLYVEVKGLLTLREITKMCRLSAGNSNYYLYQATDSDWRPRAGDWPSGAMPPQQATKIDAEAQASTAAYLRQRPERATRSSLSRKRHDDHHRCEVQRGELLFLSQDVNAARAAGRVMLTRLRRYLLEHLDTQGWVTQDVLAKLKEQVAGP